MSANREVTGGSGAVEPPVEGSSTPTGAGEGSSEKVDWWRLKTASSDEPATTVTATDTYEPMTVADWLDVAMAPRPGGEIELHLPAPAATEPPTEPTERAPAAPLTGPLLPPEPTPAAAAETVEPTVIPGTVIAGNRANPADKDTPAPAPTGKVHTITRPRILTHDDIVNDVHITTATKTAPATRTKPATAPPPTPPPPPAYAPTQSCCCPCPIRTACKGHCGRECGHGGEGGDDAGDGREGTPGGVSKDEDEGGYIQQVRDQLRALKNAADLSARRAFFGGYAVPLFASWWFGLNHRIAPYMNVIAVDPATTLGGFLAIPAGLATFEVIGRLPRWIRMDVPGGCLTQIALTVMATSTVYYGSGELLVAAAQAANLSPHVALPLAASGGAALAYWSIIDRNVTKRAFFRPWWSPFGWLVRLPTAALALTTGVYATY